MHVGDSVDGGHAVTWNFGLISSQRMRCDHSDVSILRCCRDWVHRITTRHGVSKITRRTEALNGPVYLRATGEITR
jgi:hypothetical protein